MRSFFIVFLFIGLFISFKPIKTKNNLNSFEGIIKYSVNVKIKKHNKYSDYLKVKYGKNMHFYWNDNGDLLRETYGNNIGLQFSLYKRTNNLSYTKFHGLDTLYYYNSSEVFEEIIEISSGDEETILNQQCKSLILEAKSLNNNSNFIVHYFYSGKPYIDEKLFVDLKDGFANLIYKKTKSPFLKMILDFEEFTVIYEATDIIQKELSDDKFIVPQKFFLKKV